MDKFLYGGLSGCVALTVLYPIDTIKVRLQNSKPIIGSSGLKGLYYGYRFNLVNVFPEKAIKIGTFEYLKKNNYDDQTAGAIAGFSQTIVTTPLELIKIRMQSNQLNTWRDFFKKPINPYHGWLLTIYRDVPFTVMFFGIYNKLKENNCNAITSSLLAGSISTSIVTPFDTIKTNYQLQNNNKILPIVKSLYNRGIKTFYKGIIQRIISISGFYGITMGIYELIK